VRSGDWHGAWLRRSIVSAAVGRKASELHARYVAFLDDCGQEVTLAERGALTEAMADLAAIGKGETVGRSLDGLLDSARDTLEL
jgi:hypothetical protein